MSAACKLSAAVSHARSHPSAGAIPLCYLYFPRCIAVLESTLLPGTRISFCIMISVFALTVRKPNIRTAPGAVRQ